MNELHVILSPFPVVFAQNWELPGVSCKLLGPSILGGKKKGGGGGSGQRQSNEISNLTTVSY